MAESSAGALRSWSTSLEECVCGWGLTSQNSDLCVLSLLTDIPRCSPLGAVRSGTPGAHVALSHSCWSPSPFKEP
jgi:hypothetical protein